MAPRSSVTGTIEALGEAMALSVHWNAQGTGKALNYEIAGRTLELYDRYRSEVRPVLPDSACGYFFPGRKGRPKCAASLSQAR